MVPPCAANWASLMKQGQEKRVTPKAVGRSFLSGRESEADMLIKSTPSERAASSAERQTLFRLPSSRRCTGARRDGDAWRIQSTSPIESWPPSEARRSEEHTSELQSLMRISNAVFCLKKKSPLKKHD